MSSVPRVRFAPSPTGFLHIGGARTALFNWLYARRFGGKFILRMEDTDRERSTPASVRAIIDGLKWLQIDWDEGPEVGGPFGPYFQTERLDLYKKYSEQLISEGKAYRCYCTQEELKARRAAFEAKKLTYKYEGTCRDRKDQPEGASFVVRFKMPGGEGSYSFEDKIIGRITKTFSDLDDFVLMRRDGIPLYNMGCVIDDHTMDITLVTRGQEHINSTFPQLALYEAFGWKPPEFAHLPLILGPDREKLSKRKHVEADVLNHQKNGILPEALNNFVIRLGWSHGDEEVIPREKQIEWFDFKDCGSTSGVWNPEKLLWLNQQYIKTLPVDDIANRLLPFLAEKGVTAKVDDRTRHVVLQFRERAKTLKEMAEMAHWVFSQGVKIDDKAAAKHLGADSKPLLEAVKTELLALPAWEVPALDGVIKTVSEKASVGMGKVAQPLRVAVTGNTFSPGIGDTLSLIGKPEVMARIDAALGRP
ncbi:MAG: glutamate--tRNA ligase [Myxococcaceae bacterium]